MLHPRGLRVTASIILCIVLQALGADKYTDENRPYEFGFKIDGQQHRHESKDKNGIIMGEFGFITADDVYHVTVYATDEQGGFKILSMKNIHLKSTSSSLGTPKPARQGKALALPPAPGPPGAIAIPPGKLSKPISIEPPGRSCSSCSLPTTTTQAPPPVFNQGNQNYISPNQFGAQKSPQTQEAFPPLSPNTQNSGLSIPNDSPYNLESSQQYYPSQVQNNPSQQQNYPSQQQNYPSQQQNYPSQQQNYPSQQQNYPSQQQNYPSQQQNYPAQQQNIPLGQKVPVGELVAPDDAQYVAPQSDQTVLNYPGSRKITGAGPNSPASYVPDGGYFGQDNAKQAGLLGSLGQPTGPASYPPRGMGERTAKQYNIPEHKYKSGPNGSQDPGATKPMLVSAQIQIVDKNTDIYALGPNEQKGLPPGLNQNDMTQLLYTFNYTLGFHGHFEEGYTNGVKKGYYFVTGRNGVRTRIDYVADDTGFHPKVSKDVLDLLSEDVPKPETEKDDKYGLKGYEFKWLYYPVESKRR